MKEPQTTQTVRMKLITNPGFSLIAFRRLMGGCWLETRQMKAESHQRVQGVRVQGSGFSEGAHL